MKRKMLMASTAVLIATAALAGNSTKQQGCCTKSNCEKKCSKNCKCGSDCTPQSRKSKGCTCCCK